ncbi:MAG: ATP-binding protein [Bacteroidetes bacterium]|nr:ATP-binding protein [Bacteroidota bacterium]MCY4205270.1 ATP-binding protein [Bacteroidota bacterium]
MHPYHRTQVGRLIEFVSNSSDMRIIAIVGPRQVGKTVIALQARRQLIELGYTCQYVPFDDPRFSQPKWPRDAIIPDTKQIEDLTNPKTLIDIWEEARKVSLNSPRGHVLFLDEIQLISKWSNYVKGLWDRDRREGYPLHVVILGSAVWQMLVGRNESLTGRFRELRVTHWSFPEMDRILALTTEQFMFYGGYPASLPKESEKTRFDYWHEYITETIIGSVIGRDILLLNQIKKPALMRQLIEITPNYSGQIMAYNKLLGHLQDKDNATTVKHYLNLLSDAALITTLPRYTPTPHLRMTSPPKFNALNTALMTAPSGYSLKEAQVDRSFWGRVVESAVGAHLCNTRKASTQIHYWRPRDGKHEVDFVISRGPHLVGIEVKSGKKQARRGLDAFKDRFPYAKTMIVGSGGIPLNEFFSFSTDEWIEDQ